MDAGPILRQVPYTLTGDEKVSRQELVVVVVVVVVGGGGGGSIYDLAP